jgi:hypothetical protein
MHIMLQEARIPLMLIDSLVVYGLTVWDRRLKEAKAKLAEKEGLVKEEEKKAVRDTKVAVRQQRKDGEKKAKNQGNAFPSRAPKHHIMQPDKGKKN